MSIATNQQLAELTQREKALTERAAANLQRALEYQQLLPRSVP